MAAPFPESSPVVHFARLACDHYELSPAPIGAAHWCSECGVGKTVVGVQEFPVVDVVSIPA